MYKKVKEIKNHLRNTIQKKIKIKQYESHLKHSGKESRSCSISDTRRATVKTRRTSYGNRFGY